MRLSKSILFISLTFLLQTSCRSRPVDKTVGLENMLSNERFQDSLQKGLVNNLDYINRNLLKVSPRLLLDQVKKYIPDSCLIQLYPDSALDDELLQPKMVGDIKHKGTNTQVFTLPSFSYCDDGRSYYFTDTSLPRLYLDTYCSVPADMFNIGDIDEDGIDEICVYHTTCVSRFKSLRAFSLKQNKWSKIGQVTFDIKFKQPVKERRVRKLSQGSFEMLEIMDMSSNAIWRRFSL